MTTVRATDSFGRRPESSITAMSAAKKKAAARFSNMRNFKEFIARVLSQEELVLLLFNAILVAAAAIAVKQYGIAIIIALLALLALSVKD